MTRKDHLKTHIDKIHKNELHLLDEHRNAKFSEEDCKVLCKSCDKKFISEESMKYHHDKIHGNGKFECEKCKRKVTDQWKLKKHKIICKGG